LVDAEISKRPSEARGAYGVSNGEEPQRTRIAVGVCESTRKWFVMAVPGG
jgi:hypothetical protein